MRVKDAVLFCLTKGQLKRVVEHLRLPDVDVSDMIDMTEKLAKTPVATASTLLEYLPDNKLREVAAYSGVGQETATREALLKRALSDPPDARQQAADDLPASGATIAGAKGRPHSIVAGSLVRWLEQVGVVEAVADNRVDVRFDSGNTQSFAKDSDVVKRLHLAPGTQVSRVGSPTVGVVLEEIPGDGYPTWRVAFPGTVANVAEMGLRLAAIGDPAERMRTGQLGSADEFNLRSVAADYWTAHLHNELVSLAHARVDLKPHQVSVVHRVISGYPHRFLLCDEVGLGKTIEAAMIIKELRARGQAKRVLVLVPSGLARQWQFELKTKFNESFAIFDSSTIRYLRQKGVAQPWTDSDSIIASHTWASWTPARISEIAQVEWDMVVIDEAHHARVHEDGSRTQLFRLVQQLIARKEYGRRATLMLTATPMQLERSELYSLVEMLDPVLFASDRDFRQHLDALAGLNRTVEGLEGARDVDEIERYGLIHDVARLLEIPEASAVELLHEQGPLAVARSLRDRHRLSEVLIRNRKSVVQGFQPRSAYRWEVQLSPDELSVHQLMEAVLHRGFILAEETNQNAVGFLMVTFQKLLASSSRALLKSLSARRERQQAELTHQAMEAEDAQQELEDDAEASAVTASVAPQADECLGDFDTVIELLKRLPTDSKARVLVNKLQELAEQEPDAKVLIFTEFRETQDMLTELLSASWSVHKFHGQLSADQKDAAVSAFRRGTGMQVLVSTEAGGEGRNFQFCHHLVNYDLPWNPMRIEQRIGRLDRIGQEHPITIFNFHVQGTIEGRILDVLERRIKIFEEAVGGLDPILGAAEDSIREALRLSEAERDAALERLGTQLASQITKAREAEEKLQDFIMQDKSFSAEIAQTALQVKSPIGKKEFEEFLLHLLASVNTYVYPKSPTGERRVVFHVPFVIEHPELIQGQESRRVCFDPLLDVESELVEYLGFGHPIVDALVTRVTEERLDGAAAVRRVAPAVARDGWQFNWMISVGGLKPNRFVFPVFVDDAGSVDLPMGAALLKASRMFAQETSGTAPDLGTLDQALRTAERAATERCDAELKEAQRAAQERADLEERRLHSLAEQRTLAANDRIQSCREILERLGQSGDSQVRQAIPLWEANLARAEGERSAIEADLQTSLFDLAKKRNPSAESKLLNVARIETGAGAGG
jgi:superfamily II DNA or RNA helicase